VTVPDQSCRVRCRHCRCGSRKLSSLSVSVGKVISAAWCFRFSTPTAICSLSMTAFTRTLYTPLISCGTGLRNVAWRVCMKDSADLFPDINMFDRIHGAVAIGRVSRLLLSAAGFGANRRDPPPDAAGACVTVIPRPSAGGPGASVEVHLPKPASEVLAAFTLAALLARCRAGCSGLENRAVPSRHALAATASHERWRICWSARSTPRCCRASVLARPPAAPQAAAGSFQQHPCVRRAWVPRSPRLRCGGPSHRRFA